MYYSSIWQLYSSYRSATIVKKMLKKCYKALSLKEAEALSFDNCYPFIYYLEHGQNYYELAKKAPNSIRPILLFYGMIQLLKACLLTVDPLYPESSSVLAHGVSTRKRKKRNYEFFHDEVKIQKQGLFPHVSSKLFHVKHLEAEKYTMEQLFRQIPELNQLFCFNGKKASFYPIGPVTATTFSIPLQIIDDLHMTLPRFEQFLRQHCSFTFTFQPEQANVEMHVTEQLHPLASQPLAFHYFSKSYYLPNERSSYSAFPEVLTHYLLLYNLSMICRYETEWWSELLHTYSSADYPFIQHFIDVTIEKIPYLLFLFLQHKQQNALETH